MTLLSTVHKLSEDCILSRQTQAAASVKSQGLGHYRSLPSKSRHTLLDRLTFPPQNNCFPPSSLLPTTRLKSSLDTSASSTEKVRKAQPDAKTASPGMSFQGSVKGAPWGLRQWSQQRQEQDKNFDMGHRQLDGGEGLETVYIRFSYEILKNQVSKN